MENSVFTDGPTSFYERDDGLVDVEHDGQHVATGPVAKRNGQAFIRNREGTGPDFSISREQEMQLIGYARFEGET